MENFEIFWKQDNGYLPRARISNSRFGDYYICKIEPFEYKYVIKTLTYQLRWENKYLISIFKLLLCDVIGYSIWLYRRIWLVAILRKILNLKVVTKGFSWKDHHLEDVKSYMSHLQKCTEIIKIPTMQTYFSLKFIKIEA